MENININLDSNIGSAVLSDDVFKNIAQIVTDKTAEVFPAKKESDYISCKIDDNKNVNLTLCLKLKQGSDVVMVCSQLQHKIHESILEMTGFDCSDINLDIQGFVSEK